MESLVTAAIGASLDKFRDLKLGSPRFGYTGYIDWIQPSEMTHSIMKGIDDFNRKFVAIKVRQHLYSEIPAEWYSTRPSVWCLFQRNSGDDSVWAIGSPGDECSQSWALGGNQVTPETLEQVRND